MAKQDLPTISISSDRGSSDRPWVGTHEIHHALLNNHFLDVLDVYGAFDGLLPDNCAPGYDQAGVYAWRMRKISGEFRRQVTGAFARRVGMQDTACIVASIPSCRTDEAIAETRAAMKKGVKLIVGAVVGNSDCRLFARIPMLLRVDVANEVLDVDIAPEHTSLHSKLHVAIGVKRRLLETSAKGNVRVRTLHRVQTEMWLWNHLLSGEQDFNLGSALLVGLHSKRDRAVQFGAHPMTEARLLEIGKGKTKNTTVFDTMTWNLATVPFGDSQCPLGIKAIEALSWRVSVIDNGMEWIKSALAKKGRCGHYEEKDKEGGYGIATLASTTKDANLRPNMKCSSMYDWPWANAKRKLAQMLRELTLISGISRAVIEVSMGKGIPNDYAHERVTGEALDIKSEFTSTILKMCKPGYDGPVVVPKLIKHNRSNWRRLQGFCADRSKDFDKTTAELPFADQRTFYVDFELASPEQLYGFSSSCEACDTGSGKCLCAFLDTQPTLPPQLDATSESLIFMIGCGQMIDGEWQHRVFVADSLCRKDESVVIRKWLEYMYGLVPENFGPPLLYVWGPEKQLLRQAFRRMTAEDAAAVEEMRHFKTVNILQVVAQGGVVIKGNLKNSLKTVCDCLEVHGLLDDVEGRMGDGVSNGVDAMALALHAAEVVQRDGLGSLRDGPNMDQVATYNEADCREIARVVTYLRQHH